VLVRQVKEQKRQNQQLITVNDELKQNLSKAQ